MSTATPGSSAGTTAAGAASTTSSAAERPRRRRNGRLDAVMAPSSCSGVRTSLRMTVIGRLRDVTQPHDRHGGSDRRPDGGRQGVRYDLEADMVADSIVLTLGTRASRAHCGRGSFAERYGIADIASSPIRYGRPAGAGIVTHDGRVASPPRDRRPGSPAGAGGRVAARGRHPQGARDPRRARCGAAPVRPGRAGRPAVAGVRRRVGQRSAAADAVGAPLGPSRPLARRGPRGRDAGRPPSVRQGGPPRRRGRRSGRRGARPRVARRHR